ncbi:MAG: CoA transferase [Ilumatobacteraceae bacterium]|nr:CoA transferase [Ilumatobacteraceae bacterium]
MNAGDVTSDHQEHDVVAGPLAGVTVLEIGSFIAGPFAGQLLGDYGAEVIKVEPPSGDPMRQWGITIDGESLWWPTLARNKRSIVADLKNGVDLEQVRALAAECDVLLENARPGTLAKYGLDYDTLRVNNPAIIVTHVSGFGQSGPRAHEPGFGAIGEAMGGVRHTTGDLDRPAARTGISLGDSLAAMFAVIGTMGALYERERSGSGQEVDVAIYEAVAALMESTMADYEVASVVRTRNGGTLRGVAPSNAYPTSDGSEVLIAGNADAVFARLCTAMQQPELADDQRFATHTARGEHEYELDRLIGEWTRTLTANDLLDRLVEYEVPAGRVYSAPDMLTDPHYAAREMIQRITSAQGLDIPTLGVVPKWSRTPGSIRSAGPPLAPSDTEPC